MGCDPLKEGATQVVRKLQKRGFRALLAGGCVRDRLLGNRPRDYDIATDADPEAVIEIFPNARAVGAQFGVVIVSSGGHDYEVARFRRDSSYGDGRHPDRVVFSDAREDALRRDFTVNGMFYDPIRNRIIDYVGGQRDLERGLIRTIGPPEQRLGEDRLRMIRAIRFGSRYGWRLDASLFQSIRKFSEQIQEVSVERLRDELLRILTEGGGAMGVRWLCDSGLMKQILPEVVRMQGLQQPPAFHPEGDVLTHTLIMLGLMRAASPELAMGVLLHDVGKPATMEVNDRIRFHNHDKVGARMAGEICRRLRFSLNSAEHIARLVADHHQFAHVRQMRRSRLKRFLSTDRFEEHMELHRVDCLASHGNLENYDFCREALNEFGPADIRPKPLISGRDLILLGYTPGPAFKRVLSAVEDAQLEGTVVNREGALAVAEGIFRRLGIVLANGKKAEDCA